MDWRSDQVIVIFGQGGGNRLQHMVIGVAIDHTAAQILHLSVASVLPEVAIDPSFRNLLCLISAYRLLLNLLSSEANLGDMSKGNLIGEVDLPKVVFTLMSCQMTPRMICYLFSMMRSGWMLTTVHPMALADSMARLRF